MSIPAKPFIWISPKLQAQLRIHSICQDRMSDIINGVQLDGRAPLPRAIALPAGVGDDGQS